MRFGPYTYAHDAFVAAKEVVRRQKPETFSIWLRSLEPEQRHPDDAYMNAFAKQYGIVIEQVGDFWYWTDTEQTLLVRVHEALNPATGVDQVWEMLSTKARGRTSPENVIDVLAALGGMGYLIVKA